MEGIIADAFQKIGIPERSGAETAFLAACWNMAEAALTRAHGNIDLAAQSWADNAHAKTFRTGPLHQFLKAVAAAMKDSRDQSTGVRKDQCLGVSAAGAGAAPPSQQNAASDQANVALPQGQPRAAESEAAPPPDPAKANHRLPQGQPGCADAGSAPHTAPAEASRHLPKGKQARADAGPVPETIAKANRAVPQGRHRTADAIVPPAGGEVASAMPTSQPPNASPPAAPEIVPQRPTRKEYGTFAQVMRMTVFETTEIITPERKVALGEIRWCDLDTLWSYLGRRTVDHVFSANIVLGLRAYRARYGGKIDPYQTVGKTMSESEALALKDNAIETTMGSRFIVPKALEHFHARA